MLRYEYRLSGTKGDVLSRSVDLNGVRLNGVWMPDAIPITQVRTLAGVSDAPTFWALFLGTFSLLGSFSVKFWAHSSVENLAGSRGDL